MGAPLTLTLADLRAGESARIACLECERAGRCERLMAYGLIQGQTITLVQSKPAFVIRVDETELALDEQVARCVHIERTPLLGLNPLRSGPSFSIRTLRAHDDPIDE